MLDDFIIASVTCIARMPSSSVADQRRSIAMFAVIISISAIWKAKQSCQLKGWAPWTVGEAHIVEKLSMGLTSSFLKPFPSSRTNRSFKHARSILSAPKLPSISSYPVRGCPGLVREALNVPIASFSNVTNALMASSLVAGGAPGMCQVRAAALVPVIRPVRNAIRSI